MNTPTCLTSACRHCRFYEPQGRRGGLCSQLDAPVRGTWKACSLAVPPFAASWETLENIKLWEQRRLVAQEIVAIETSLTVVREDVPASNLEVSVNFSEALAS